jgi:hypothetical protein
MINSLREGPIETIDLVARIRRFRGRLTKKQITDQLGFKSAMTGFLTVARLCREYEISTADPEPDYRPGVINRDQVLELAAEQLRREIAAAQKEAKFAPPYRPGPLIWAQGEEGDRRARREKSDRKAAEFRPVR